MRRIAWLGTRTDDAQAMASFFEQVLGLTRERSEGDIWVFSLPDGSKVEVFGPSSGHDHFPSCPVAEFLVENVAAATEELKRAGVEIIFGPVFFEEDDVAWVLLPRPRRQHLRADAGARPRAALPRPRYANPTPLVSVSRKWWLSHGPWDVISPETASRCLAASPQTQDCFVHRCATRAG
ncbi:MAG: VOC family protein [Actinomycetota bacterium]